MTRNSIPGADLASNLKPDAHPYPIVALMGTALVTAVYMRSGLTVLSAFVIEEFGISRSQFGWIFTVFAVSATLASPIMGSMVDGSIRRAVFAVYGFGAAGTILASLSSNFAMLTFSAVVGGLALATGNPVTNRVIAERVPVSLRGRATGLKQSGPQLTMLVAGLILPAMALGLNWRWALVSGVVVPVLGAIATTQMIKPDKTVIPRASRRMPTRGERGLLTWLAIASFLMAMALASVQAFLPLYAQEAVAMSASEAGLMAALLGLGGLVGRIGWTHAEHRFTSRVTLLIAIPIGAGAATGIIALATPRAQWMLWIGSFAAGFVMLAWHAVAWLFVINTSHRQSIGRSSAILQVGTFLGFGFGPPLTGYLVDYTGSYDMNWIAVIVLFLVVSVVARRLRHYLARQNLEAGSRR